MWDPFFVAVAAQALLTLCVLRAAATDREHFGLPKLLLVAFALTVVGAALQHALEPRFGLFHLVPQAAVALYILHDVCWLTWSRACRYAVILGVLTAGADYGAMRLCSAGDARAVLASTLAALAPPVPGGAAGTSPAAAPMESESATVRDAAGADWSGARRGLHVEGRLCYGGHVYVLVNEHVYTQGQTIARLHGGSNYTWQVLIDASNSVSLLPLQIRAAGR